MGHEHTNATARVDYTRSVVRKMLSMGHELGDHRYDGGNVYLALETWPDQALEAAHAAYLAAREQEPLGLPYR